MTNKVLILGFGGLDPRAMQALLDAGKLPNFSKLSFQRLRTTIPPSTLVAWGAAATGADPGHFGIFDFVGRDPKTYRPRLNLAEEKTGLLKTSYRSVLQGDPFWKLLSAAGVPVTVLHWPLTFPAPKIKGRVLSGLGTVDLRGSLNSYTFLTSNPEKRDEPGSDRVVLLESTAKDPDRFRAMIPGPALRKRRKLHALYQDIQCVRKNISLEITVGTHKFHLRPGEWSDYIKVQFHVMPLVDLSGIFRIHLHSLFPHVELYVSSIEVDPEHPAVQICTPADFSKELSHEIGIFQTSGRPADIRALTDQKLSMKAFLEQVRHAEQERAKMLFYELERFSEGALAVVFESGEQLAHTSWTGNGKDPITPGPELEQHYVEKDRLLGEVLERIDPDTRLVVFSPYGFSEIEREVNLNSWLVQEGYMKFVESSDPSERARIDWSVTSVYALGFTSLFLNLEGREGQGIVPRSDYQALVSEIIAKLSRMREKKQKVFSRIYAGPALYQGKYVDQAPDIILGFREGYRAAVEAVVGKTSDQIISENVSGWRGEHLVDAGHVPGILLTNFPIRAKAPSIYDIAPTILKTLNVPLADEFIGGSFL